MPTKKQIIIIGVLSMISLGLGYWYGMPKEGSGGDSSITVMPVDLSVVANIGSLKQRELIGNNRDYQFDEVPKELDGLNFVRMECRKNGDYEYRVLGECKVYALIVLDTREHIVDGSELIPEGWKKTEYTIKTREGDLILVYEKIVSKGKYEMKSRGNWAYMLGGRIPIKIEE